MKSIKKILISLLVVLITLGLSGCGGGNDKKEPVKIGVPDDGTNQYRAIKLLETAGLIKVRPEAGYSPELSDITEYIYNIEIIPTTANTLPSTLDDFGASTINGTYSIPYGLLPSRDALIIEKQDQTGNNPYINIIAARTADKDNPVYKKIVEAYQTQIVAQFLIENYKETYFPAFDYDSNYSVDADFCKNILAYKSSSEGKIVVKVGVCGANNDQWIAVQKVLDEKNANIYIQLVQFDAYNLPNEALNSGDIDLNAFQHVAYLNNEVKTQSYAITPIGDTLIAPLALYSKKVKSIQELKDLAGLKQ